jgi:hypothetical protein
LEVRPTVGLDAESSEWRLHRHIFGEDDSELDADDRVRVDTLLDMYAAALDDGLSTTMVHPETKSHEDWRQYAWDTLQASKILSEYVSKRPYFSYVTELVDSKQPTAEYSPHLPPRAKKYGGEHYSASKWTNRTYSNTSARRTMVAPRGFARRRCGSPV